MLKLVHVLHGLLMGLTGHSASYNTYIHTDGTKQLTLLRIHTQDNYYNRRAHGQPFSGDLAWLHLPVVLNGCSRKLHRLQTGPLVVHKQISDVKIPNLAHLTLPQLQEGTF